LRVSSSEYTCVHVLDMFKDESEYELV
jgi:hypothetical protein